MKKRILIGYAILLLLFGVSNFLFGDQRVIVGTLKWLPLPIGVIFYALDKRKLMRVWKVLAALYALNYVLTAFWWMAALLRLISLDSVHFDLFAVLLNAWGVVLLLRFAFPDKSSPTLQSGQ